MQIQIMKFHQEMHRHQRRIQRQLQRQILKLLNNSSPQIIHHTNTKSLIQSITLNTLQLQHQILKLLCMINNLRKYSFLQKKKEVIKLNQNLRTVRDKLFRNLFKQRLLCSQLILGLILQTEMSLKLQPLDQLLQIKLNQKVTPAVILQFLQHKMEMVFQT